MRLVEGLLLFLAMVVVLVLLYGVRVECFQSIGDMDAAVLEQTQATQLVHAAYMDVLKRPPSPEELDDNTRRVVDKGLTRFALENILLNSEEYQREVKNQSDDPHSELRRVTSQQFIIAHIVNLFELVRDEKPVPQIILPLKDVYQLLGPQDDARFREFLSSPFYADWENDVLMRQQDSYKTSTTMEVFDLWYRGNSTRQAPDGDADPTRLSRGTRATALDGGGDFMGGGGTSFGRPSVFESGDRGGRWRDDPTGAGQAPELRSVDQGDTDSAPIIEAVQTSAKPFRLYFNPDQDKTVRDRRGALLERPPVCSSLGAPMLAQPYMVVDKQLIGTPIGEAVRNDPMLPKFEYRQYVEIPADQVKVVEHSSDTVDDRPRVADD